MYVYIQENKKFFVITAGFVLYLVPEFCKVNGDIVILMNGVGFPSAPQVKFPITEKITKMAISSETSVIVYLSVLLCLVAEKPILK